MPITKRPQKTPASAVDQAAAARFINAAPDAVKAVDPAPTQARSNIVRGNQVQVSFALPPGLLVQVDHAADALNISRAAFIKQALSRAVMPKGV